MYKKEKKREKVFVKFGKITDVLYIIYTDYKNILYFSTSTINLFLISHQFPVTSV